MFISGTVLWIIMALILAGAEILTSTFYLLVLALGCLGAAAASYFSLGLNMELIVCAFVIVVGSFVVNRIRARRTAKKSERLLELDKGRQIEVDNVGSDGLAVVQYRGAPWIARSENGPLSPGHFEIVRVDGTQLVIRPFETEEKR